MALIVVGRSSRRECQASCGAARCKPWLLLLLGVPMRGRWEALTVSDEHSTGGQGHQIVPGASRQLSHRG